MQSSSPSDPLVKDYYASFGNLRTGNRLTRPLLAGREGAPNNYKFSFGGGEGSGDWTTPRHRHTFEQIRHPLVGDYVIKKDEVLPAGWVAYFPESVYYGPQVKSGNLTMVSLQFGGPSGNGYWSLRQRKQAFQNLKSRGTLENGVFSWLDGTGRRHNQDAAEAAEEEAMGRKVVYPEPRYGDLVMMNPAAFEWRKDADQAGVARKHLGTFTEREVRVCFVRVEKGATLNFGGERAPEVLFVKEGCLTHANAKFDRHSAMSLEGDDDPVVLDASEPTELFYVKLPTF